MLPKNGRTNILQGNTHTPGTGRDRWGSSLEDLVSAIEDADARAAELKYWRRELEEAHERIFAKAERKIVAETGGAAIPITAPITLPIIDIGAWQGEPPPRQFAWGNWLPLVQTTMLTGKGGVGKSLLAQMLMTAIAMGIPFLGMDTRSMPALYWTNEDDPDELWRRQDAINQMLGIEMADLKGRLHLVSLCGEADTSLVTFDHDLRMKTTDGWAELRQAIDQLKIGIFAIDNVTDAMAGDMNDVHQVAQFVNLLTGVAIDTQGAALLLHHPNKAGDEWLGSVAWHNKVRSRLVLERPADAVDMDLRVLSSAKANYGPHGGDITLRWLSGAFIRDDALPESMRATLDQTARSAADNEIFLACLAQRNIQERAVSEKQSPTYAPSVFAEMPEAKGLSKKRLAAAMDRLFRLGRIERAELWKGPDRKPVYGLHEVAADGAGNGAGNTVRATESGSPQPAENRAGNAGNIHTPSLQEGGASPSGATAPPPEWDDDDDIPIDWGPT